MTIEHTHELWTRRQRCINGHPFSEANTYQSPKMRASGQRQCRRCMRDTRDRYKARQAALAAAADNDPQDPQEEA
jgi:hypothetical protein